MVMLRSIVGMAAIVTGAASGMGAATAILFGQEGALVAVVDRNQDGIDRVVAEIAHAGGTARGWLLDVSDRDAIRNTIAEIASAFHRIDIVVNNAGIHRRSPLNDENYDDIWDQIIAINLTAHQRIVRAALPWLRTSPAARIVNIASTEALGATPDNSAYAASKAGAAGLVRALAVDLGKDGITVNGICPGPIETPMTAFASPEDQAAFASGRTVLHRYGQPEEVAHMILSLCLPAASYITGVMVPVDGGLMARNA
jgi:3-oxoacyl-[acyl-carrier protein] reductase